MAEIKKVQIYPSASKIHTAYRSLVSDPPEGYVFIQCPESGKQRAVNYLRKYKLIKNLYHLFLKIFKTTKMIELSSSMKEDDSIDLIFSMGHLYKGNKPYVVDIIDNTYCLSGYNYDIFINILDKIEKSILDKNCRKVICANESSLKSMKKYFSKEVLKKTILIRPAVKTHNFKNKQDKNKIRILFMGSINNPKDFETKGGLNAIETFEKISQKYINLELVVRSKVPEEIRSRIESNSKINLIEGEISFEEVINLYAGSDILLCPAHTYVGLMALLESMSFKLPIVALDTYAARDYIKNGYNGFLIRKSNKIKGYYNESYPTNIRTKEFLSEIKNVDNKVIDKLVEKVDILIKNKRLRIKMGENGRKMIDSKFSIEARNKKLKKIFDEAIK